MGDLINNDTLNVVYSTDDNYAQHTGVSIISLLDNNRHFLNIEIYIIDNNISAENRDKLVSIVDKYNRKLTFIDFSEYENKLKLNMEWSISISAYARLFLSDMLPSHINKVLYYDCDTIIVDKLDEIWNEDISNYFLAGVKDTVNSNIKIAVGMNKNDDYINSGMLLINLRKWRKDNITDKFLGFIEQYNGKVTHHDQGVINGMLNGFIKILPLKFNVMTVFYTMKREEIIKYYNIDGDFYSEDEINEAINYPVYIHFTPGFVSRPWVRGCKHPKKQLYWKYISISPWSDFKCIKDSSKFQVKAINWLFKNFGINFVQKITSIACK